MQDRPRFFDDIAGLAGGALSALSGIREEMESQMRARMEDMIRRLDLVRRDELDAVVEMAANARAGQEAAEARLAALEARVAAMAAPPTAEARLPADDEPRPGLQDGAAGV